MKKYRLLLVLVLVLGVFTLTGCKKDEKKQYNKETNIYSVESLNGAARLSFELAKDLGYEDVVGSNEARFRNKDDYSMIQLVLNYNYKTSASITKKEKDFYSEYYKDYKEVKYGKYEGWSIVKETSTVTDYEISLVLTEPDQEGKVYAVDVKVTQSPLQKNKEDFNTMSFVESDDFQHILDTLQLSFIE